MPSSLDKQLPADSAPVLWISHKQDEVCAACKKELWPGNIVHIRSDSGVRCRNCAGFGDLTFLPSGSHALTRRATKLSTRHAVVVKFSRARKRAERQGVLVEQRAIDEARKLCDADDAKRQAVAATRAVKAAEIDAAYITSFTARVLELFPNCPRDEAARIAEHACRKYSGRVGRSAAAKELEAHAVTLAVRAHVRHVHTKYDELLARDGDRHGARQDVRESIERVVNRWRG